ncbi:MAG: prepilin-type N-terminal cleavage/methylation domain-containing protein [Verrucomicrobia bacterium]|jgi:prepilin-type N-terminal cleavage/methylation domain-containing protein|nr:prepilin-type N-terminal cleavage/methylation domain-containing protein [Verrucomicrobiota bacterium]
MRRTLQPAAAAKRRPRGFTLLEVILAVSIAGALLAAAASLMVAITDAWLKRQDRHFFEDHVDGVTEFLQASFAHAGSEITVEANDSPSNNNTESGENEDANNQDNRNNDQSNQGSALLRKVEEPITWQSPPGFANYEDPLIFFRLKERPPLLVQIDDAPIAGVESYLHFEENEGLSLLWYTPIQEESEDIRDLRRTPISDLVTKVEYIYWDERFESWETEEEPLEGEGNDQFILPRFLKLTFEYEGVEKERTISIPVPSLDALIF